MVVGAITFSLAVIVSIASSFFLENISSLLLGFLLLLVIIFINVIFDAIGTAATAATEPPFHAKAADRVVGANEAVFLVRNADRVANYCGDVVGDVCGTISGAIGATIALRLIIKQPTLDELIISVFMSAVIATITVGGKAVGKTLAVEEANEIIFAVGRILAGLKRAVGRSTKPEVRKASKKGK